MVPLLAGSPFISGVGSATSLSQACLFNWSEDICVCLFHIYESIYELWLIFTENHVTLILPLNLSFLLTTLKIMSLSFCLVHHDI